MSNGKSNMQSRALLRIASRGSPLALAQARLVRAAIAKAQGWDTAALDELCPIIAVKTSGDRIQKRPLADSGGKGLFTKEIEEALIAGEADIAVHSMKDVPSVLPAGLEIAVVLPRADPRDVFVARDGAPLSELKPGARVGTSSVRRTAQMLRARADVKIVLSRGNVETRLARLEAGDADAIVLARAGLQRLGNTKACEVLDGPDWLPALCQGAIGIELRTGDTDARAFVAAIDHSPTALAVACERGFLAALDGSCRTPVAGLARIDGERLTFAGEVLALDGRKYWRAERDVSLGKNPAQARQAAHAFGRDAADEIRARAGNDLPVS